MDSIPVILVADDDPNDVFFLRRAFQKGQIKCLIMDVPKGHEAIQYLEGLPPYDNRKDFPLPHLVLLDLKMPLMNGFDVLEWLIGRPESVGLPALVLSSSAHEEDVSRARDLGARAYHVKPSELSQLIDLAQELNSKWLIGHVQPRSAGITASSGPSH
jgi:CheY-like chemotaxis protein